MANLESSTTNQGWRLTFSFPSCKLGLMTQPGLPKSVVEVPANWWRAAALSPERNLLIIADSDAWTLNLTESVILTMHALSSLELSPMTATDDQIVSMSLNRILAFTPLPDPKIDGDIIVVGNN